MTQVDHTIVRISARIILYIMLDHLGICRVIYRLRMYSQNTISVVVLFYTSVQSNGICILYWLLSNAFGLSVYMTCSHFHALSTELSVKWLSFVVL